MCAYRCIYMHVCVSEDVVVVCFVNTRSRVRERWEYFIGDLWFLGVKWIDNN